MNSLLFKIYLMTLNLKKKYWPNGRYDTRTRVTVNLFIQFIPFGIITVTRFNSVHFFFLYYWKSKIYDNNLQIIQQLKNNIHVVIARIKSQLY